MACRFSALPPLQKNLLRDAKYLQLAWRISADLTMNHRPDSEGTAGVGMGCNLFQSGDSIAMVQAVGKVVHERLQPKPAYEFYEDAKSAKVRIPGCTLNCLLTMRYRRLGFAQPAFAVPSFHYAVVI